MIFQQRSARLHNGQKVREGDTVSFIDSDGVTRTGAIQRDRNNPERLYFWNDSFDIQDYENARLEKCE